MGETQPCRLRLQRRYRVIAWVLAQPNDPVPAHETLGMLPSRRILRLLLLIAIDTSITACHFHIYRNGNGYNRPTSHLCR